MLAGAAKSTVAAFALAERFDKIEIYARDRNDHELRDAFHWIDGERCLAAIPARNKELALIIGIDESDQVPEYDAVLMAEARSWQDDCSVARVGNVDRHPSWDEFGFAWFEDERRIDAGA